MRSILLLVLAALLLSGCASMRKDLCGASDVDKCMSNLASIPELLWEGFTAPQPRKRLVHSSSYGSFSNGTYRSCFTYCTDDYSRCNTRCY